jgi:tetratricopeptide (TPR) repeat protein
MADITRALEINPGDSDNHEVAGVLLTYVGRFDEAQAAFDKALDLDPLSVRALSSLGEMTKDRGDFRQAELVYRRAIQLAPNPGYALSGLAQTYVLQGNYPGALAAAERLGDDPPRQLFCFALVHHSLGSREQADRVLDELIRRYAAGWAFQIGAAYAWRGETDKAFAWLDRALRQHDGGLAWAKSDPFLKSLHADARFPVLLRKLGLEP